MLLTLHYDHRYAYTLNIERISNRFASDLQPKQAVAELQLRLW